MKHFLYWTLFLCSLAVLILYPGCKKEQPLVSETAAPEIIEEPEIVEEPEIIEEPVEELSPEVEITQTVVPEEEPVEPAPPPEAEKVEEQPEEQIVEQIIEPEETQPEIVDKVSPSIELTEPTEGSFYKSTVVLKGRVTDAALMPEDDLGSVSSLLYEISHPELEGGSIEIGEDGGFYKEIALDGIREDMLLNLRAEDASGNVSEAAVKLLDDQIGPHLVVISPPDQSVYQVGESIVVTGQVTSGTDEPGTSEVRSLQYKAGADDTWIPIDYANDGAFSFSIPISDRIGIITFDVKGEDKNGHSSRQLVTLLDSAEGPVITVKSPEGEGIYASRIRIRGTILSGDEKGEIVAASYGIHDTDRKGEIEWQRDGSFTLEIDTEGLQGMQILRLKAEDTIGRINEKTVVLRDDGVGPFVSITSPDEGSFYGPYVTVSGLIANSEEEEGIVSEIRTIGWELVESGASGTERFRRNGEFQFEVPMLGMTGDQTLRLVGTDKNGNRTVKEIVLLEEEIKEEVIVESKPPMLIVTSPGEDSFYKKRIVLSGVVTDSEEENKTVNEIEYLYYQLKNEQGSLTEEIYFDLDGTFSYIVPVEYLSGFQSLTITAEKRDGMKTTEELNLFDGNVEPELSITYPVEGSSYGAFVQISGKTDYPDSDVPEGMGIKRLFYEIFPENYQGNETDITSGDIEITADGGFQFVFTGRGMDGSRIVKITAEAANGNRIEEELFMVQGESEIPSFSAISGDEEAVIFWDPVPIAETYILKVAAEGETSSIEDVGSPFRVSSLTNGILYEFSLEARLPEDIEPAVSSIVQAVPMDTGFLKPSVSGEFGQVRLMWRDVSGIPGYVVLRSEKEKGEYKPVGEKVNGNLFVDTAVRFGTQYFYRIKPAIEGGVESEPVAGESLAAPDVKVDLAGTIPSQTIYHIHIEGNYLYTANGVNGVKIIDISDASNPQEVAAIPLEDARDVVIRSDYAYIANGEKGLTIVDITNPINPVITGSRKTSNALGVVVTDTHAYIADGTYGIKIIDITNPKRPKRVGLFDATNAQGIELTGDRLFLADGHGGIKTFKLRGNTVRLETEFQTSNAVDLAVSGNNVYVADPEEGLLILDSTKREALSLEGSFNVANTREVQVQGRYVYILDEKAGLRILDVYDPERPVLFDVYPMENAGAIAVQENKAYIAEPGQIRIINVFTQGKSYVVSSIVTGGLSYDLQLAGNFAYLSDHQGGVKVIDVSDPAALGNGSPMAKCITEFAENVSIAGDFMYVADGFSGLKVFDMRGFNEAVGAGEHLPLGLYETEGMVRKVTVSGNYAFLAKEKLGLEIVDISNPENIRSVSTYSGPNVKDVSVYGDVLFIAGGRDGLYIGTVENGEFVERAVVPDLYSLQVAIAGSTAFIVTPTMVRFLDIFDPVSPQPVGYYPTESCEDIVIYGKYAYIAEGYKGLTILDLSDISFPVIVSVCEELFAFGVDVEQAREPAGYAFVADSFGMQVVEIHVPRWLQ